MNALDRAHLPAAQRVGCHRWNSQHRSQSLRRRQSGNGMRSRMNVLGAGELKLLTEGLYAFHLDEQ